MICWLRHAESTWNAAERLQYANRAPPLTELGRQQATEAARSFEGRSFAAVLTSPARRAVETAEIVSRDLGVGFGVDDRLAERDREEPIESVRRRIRALLDEHPGDLLLISHGDTIAIAVASLTGRPCAVPGNAQTIETAR